jgi:PAS domain S-box-containing protein
LDYFNDLWRTFIDADSSLIYLKDENFKYVFVNKAFETLYGMKESDIVGHDDFELIDSELAAEHRKTDYDALEKKTIVINEVSWGNRVFQTTKFLVKLQNGNNGIGAFARDVTEEYKNKKELEKMNASLRAGEENIRLLLNSTAEGIYGIDLKGDCTFCNDSCLRLLGYMHQEELIGSNMHYKIHHKRPDGTELPLEECHIFKAFTKGEGIHVEDEVLWRADGTCFQAEYYSYPQFRNGEIVGAVVTFTDVTERKRALQEIVNTNTQLQEKQYSLEEQNAIIEELNSQLEEENFKHHQQKEILHAIIDSLGAGIMMTDSDGAVLFVNKAWKDMFSYLKQRSRLYAQDAFYLNDTDISSAERILESIVTGMEDDSEILLKLKGLLTDSHRRYNADIEQTNPINRFLNIYSNPCLSQNNSSFGRVFVVRDVSHQKEVDRLKLELISTVSHELRTPMSSIMGFSELILTRNLSEERNKEYIGIINSEARRLTNLINDFLDIQRMESGKHQFNKQEYDISQIIEEAQSLFQNYSSRHRISYHQAAKSMPRICCDRDKILQVLSNLISNAVKYSPDGGEVNITAEVEGENIKVSVSDQGLGIPEDLKGNLFTKFYRIHNDDRREIGGTGLGLAICKEIIRFHNGEISVESSIGKGSTFWFSLPHIGSSICSENQKLPYNSPCGDCDGDVLIVEDDESMVKLIMEVLKGEELVMKSVSSGEAALDVLSRNSYKLIILDIALSGQLTGWDVLKELKANKKTSNIPIIISSVYENKSIASERDIEDYLVKPFEPEQLLKLIQKAFNGKFNSKMMLNSDGELKGVVLEMLNKRGIAVRQIDHSGNVLVITLKEEEGLENE